MANNSELQPQNEPENGSTEVLNPDSAKSYLELTFQMLSLSYLIFTCYGIFLTVYYYSKFNIDILSYSDFSDMFLFALKKPIYVFYLFLTFLALIILRAILPIGYEAVRLGRTKAVRNKLAGRVTRSKYVYSFVIISSYGLIIQKNIEKEYLSITSSETKRVIIEFKDEPVFMNSDSQLINSFSLTKKRELPIFIDKTNSYFFIYYRTTSESVIIPIDGIQSIRFVDSNKISQH